MRFYFYSIPAFIISDLSHTFSTENILIIDKKQEKEIIFYFKSQQEIKRTKNTQDIQSLVDIKN